MRRSIAIGVLAFLVIGLFYRPVPPVLVCRMTGQEMAPVYASIDTETSCCTIAMGQRADGSVHYELTDPGCCDLRVLTEREPIPATLSVPVLPAVAVLFSAPPVPIPGTVVFVAFSPATNVTSPRGPPPDTASSRGPPSRS